ncbi:MAG: hypothetical protein U0V72_15450 [Cytophagales bacterium]
MLRSFLSKKRYFLGLLVTVAGIGVWIAFLTIKTTYKASENYQISQNSTIIASHIQEALLSANAFMMNAYTDKNFYVNGFNDNTIAFDNHLALANESYLKLKSLTGADSTLLLFSNLKKFNSLFGELKQAYKLKGFKDIGYEGQMRSAIHSLESSENFTFKEQMLTLRRHEKDFLLRKDVEYIKKFTKDFDLLVSKIELSSVNEAEKSQMLADLKTYKEYFEKIIDIEKQIGLNQNDGLRNQLSQTSYNLTSSLTKIQNNVDGKTNLEFGFLKYTIWLASAVLLVFLVLIAVLYYIFSEAIKKPIEKLKNVAEEIAYGKLSVNIEYLKKYTILAELTASIQKIIEAYKNTIVVISNISKNETKNVVEILHKDDEVGLALKAVNDEFILMREKEAQAMWLNEGLAKYADISRQYNTLEEFGEHTLLFLIKYLSLNQGAFYVVNDNLEIEIKRVSTYAYDRKKYVSQILKPREGLVGQAFLEQESIYLTDIPNGYMKITSGLGEATASSVYILVCKSQEKVNSLLEFASFQTLLPQQIDFLEKIGEAIGASVYFIKTNEHTQKLLNDFKEQKEHLRNYEDSVL